MMTMTSSSRPSEKAPGRGCRVGTLKAQSAFEFIVIFGIFLAALILGVWFSHSKSMEAKAYSMNLQVSNLLEMVAEKVNTAWLEGSGFSTNLTMPLTVANSDYIIFIESNFIHVVIGDTDYSRSLLTMNVTGSFSKGGINTLSNIDGIIEIN